MEDANYYPPLMMSKNDITFHRSSGILPTVVVDTIEFNVIWNTKDGLADTLDFDITIVDKVNKKKVVIREGLQKRNISINHVNQIVHTICMKMLKLSDNRRLQKLREEEKRREKGLN